MARHPEWFERLDSIEETVRQSETIELLGRQEIAAVFGVSDRDSIRLLHKFGTLRTTGGGPARKRLSRLRAATATRSQAFTSSTGGIGGTEVSCRVGNAGFRAGAA